MWWWCTNPAYDQLGPWLVLNAKYRRDQPTTADSPFKTADNPVILIQFIIFYPF
jgi:hypothetical protein